MSEPIEILQTMAMPPRIAERLGDRYKIHKLWEASDQDAFVKDLGDRVRAVITMGHGAVPAAMLDALHDQLERSGRSRSDIQVNTWPLVAFS